MADSQLDRKRKSKWDDDGGDDRRPRKPCPWFWTACDAAQHVLDPFLDRHRDLLSAGGTKLSAEEYHSSRRVCYDEDHERGLYVRYDPLLGRDVFSWHRCQYALSKKVDITQHHERPDCDGWSKEKGVGVLGPLLARCGCPFEIRSRRYVWLVDPKDKVVEVGGKQIRHGDEHVHNQ